MSTRALGPSALALTRALGPVVTEALDGGLRVRVACSGGPDSLALAAALAWHARREPALMAEGLVVDHQLQAGSARVAARAAEQMRLLGLTASVATVEVGRATGLGPEAAARRSRYEALRGPGPSGVRPGLVLLGHTLDDQAETVLLGLVRGSGTRSLAGMAARSGTDPVFVRPLLGTRRADTAKACAEWGLEPWQDPQNTDASFTRVRVRHEIMPLLEERLGPGVAQALARTARLAAADAELLDALAARTGAEVARDGGLDAGALLAQPPALRGRVVRAWLLAAGVPEPTEAHTSAVLALVENWHGQRGVDLPGRVRVVRAGGRLRIR
ncbi:tRNA lysidine(34) synthetase TilS [Propionibacterium australiense]|uniref:tRNA(Ile)-lysidine synthase n=1 Tax=Propionibacterium australiense TaxID=119981 RepID=A0A383S5M7_9ACTN|nr:tRNA lysidine(34) synthetase TilS [Propionibacterium australiense]RLP09744.1 tRNA lysidine(34) synthetase TilS [Propionibacterium australiense]SYZ33217.1 tRNAIle-lysidine synthase [Propionibacterium australiense]VEH89304.1 tRNA(Ile)-lysidine synthase [Propionibacterium australiense]